MAPGGGHDDVTVVIPNFNHGRFLEEAVESALAQQGGPPRVVVVDDGSTEPASLEALARLAGRAGVHLRPNAAPSAARNAGMRLARTPLLLPLDADDRLAPGALDRLKGGLR